MLITDEKSGYPLDFRQRLFNENNMFTRVKTIAQMENLGNTLTALGYMREKHSGQYINHPLMMACHAHAMGIKDDAVLAAILLHDVVEDTSADVGDLPVSDEIKEIVSLLTFRQLPGKTKAESKEIYYSKIIENKKACMVKVIDRCSNVSTMAGCFKREKIVDYINETEKYIIPLLTTLKNRYPEYGDPAFLVKYHIISLLESIKALL